MEREDAPTQFYPVFLLQTIGTHGTEVAPGSDIIEKNLYNGCFVHARLPLVAVTLETVSSLPTSV